MAGNQVTRFFLGANSKDGFTSLYDSFAPPDKGCFTWVLKGGPGCGKSSFMKKIGSAAEEAGRDVEYISCSGDPDSLDGVYIPQAHIAYVDGTAPHVREAVFPGAASMYLDLGKYYQRDRLHRELGRIGDLNRHYKSLYARAYDYLRAAALVSPKNLPNIWGEAEKGKINGRLSGVVSRELGKNRGSAELTYRFISAISCKGYVFMQNTLDTLCSRVYVLDNELGIGHYYLEKLLEAAKGYRTKIIVCPDPLEAQKLQALIFPELSLGFIARDCSLPYDTLPYRHIRLDALVNKDVLHDAKFELRQAKKLSGELLAMGTQALSQAKELHDILEDIYNPCVDFDGVYGEAAEHMEMLNKAFGC